MALRCRGLSFTLDLLFQLSFKYAIDFQPQADCMRHPAFQGIGIAMFVLGNIYVLSSMWVLGVTGTYLGKETKTQNKKNKKQTHSFTTSISVTRSGSMSLEGE